MATPTAFVEFAPVEEVVFEPVPPPLARLVPLGEYAPPARKVGLVRRSFGFLGWVGNGIASAFEWLFGAIALMVGLAILAALPILQFLSLGYLLEAGARVARSGRLRDGFIGVRKAARLGGIVLWSWLLLLPVRLVAGAAQTAQIIDPGSPAARGWRLGLFVLIGVTALHIISACARGGKLRHFLWPFNMIWLVRRFWRGGYYTEMRDNAWNAIMGLRLPYYFSLGFRGFLAAFAWLVLPASLLAMGHLNPVFGFLGAAALAYVLQYLPFLQMRMATDNRLAAAFDRRAAKREFCQAPWIAGIAFVVTLATALPLYFAKLEAVPAEAAWLPSLFFIVFIFPARILTGWSLYWARRSEKPRHWFFRWTGRVPFLPAAMFYVLILFFTQYTSWNGVWSLYEQHAFMMPAPFFGM